MKYRGFSIIEVMFAIMILGVGFIMVAAMFPVAIQQSQASIDESTGRVVAVSGAVQTASVFRTIPEAQYSQLSTVRGAVTEFRRIGELPDTLKQQREMINTSTIYEADRRYGWSSLYQYRYDATNPTLKSYSIITVALRARNIDEQVSLVDAIGFSGFPDASWQTDEDGYDNAAIRCRVDFSETPGGPGYVTIDGSGDNPDQAMEAAVEGAVIVVRSHSDPSVVGRVYYLEEYDDSTGGWYLSPKSDALPASGLGGVEVFLFGRGLRYPNREWGAGNPREGLSQVVGVYKMISALP